MSSYRTIPLQRHTQRKATDSCCILCHKPLAVGHVTRMVHVIDGGSRILHQDDEEKYEPDIGDMLWFPIGPDCAKTIGYEYTVLFEK